MSLLHFRPGTWDNDIWLCVQRDNEYRLDRLVADQVVLDIGAHIGAFTYHALDRGASKVVAVEPDQGNFDVLRHNLHTVCAATDRAVLIAAAACGDLPEGGRLYYQPVAGNTGGGNTLGTAGVPVVAIPLTDLIVLAAGLTPIDRVALLKLDCEGSEWNILDCPLPLDCVDAICGEYHWPSSGIARPSAGREPELELRRLLEPYGYQLHIEPTSDWLGHFWAWRWETGHPFIPQGAWVV